MTKQSPTDPDRYPLSGDAAVVASPDLPAIEQLEEALAGYPGTLLLVTHDRRMLDAVHLTRRWHVAAGAVHEE